MLTEPPVKKIDLHFPLGLEVTARNLKGVTIKDALDAIHKQFKKRVRLYPNINPAHLIPQASPEHKSLLPHDCPWLLTRFRLTAR